MGLTITGSAASGGTDYSMALSDIESQIAQVMGWSTSTTAELAAIDRAITVVGQSVCTWEGRNWWFLRSSGTFSTAASDDQYDLRTEVGADVLAPTHVWRSTVLLEKTDYDTFIATHRTYTGEGTPYLWAMSGASNLNLHPTPSAVETITVDYIKRHSQITNAGSVDSDLIIPGEFHYTFYVDGSLWLLRQETLAPESLRASSGFMEGILNLQASAPDEYATSGSTLPDGKHIIIIEDT